MQSTASTDSYYFPLVQNAGYGQSTVPAPIETSFDPPQWFTPPIHPPHTSFPNQFLPFETPWFKFAELATPNMPPPHGGPHNSLGQSTPAPETNGSAMSPGITPTRRMQKGNRQCEAKRISVLQNDEYVESFSGARVICAACHKSIKLDTRDGARFYPGFWLKHRGRCKKIGERSKGERSEKGRS